MSRLTKGLYGTQFRRSSTTLFGLACGQMRGGELVHNGGWYNAKGEKIGWGDLDNRDFQRLQRELEDGELFIVLGESDSFWNFVKHNPATTGADCKTSEEEAAPGPEYVADKCRHIFTKRHAYYVDRYGSYAGKSHMQYPRGGPSCEVLSAEAAKALIMEAAAKA